MTFKSLVITISLISPLILQGQEIIKLDDVVKIAIENNFNIKIARNDLDITAVNATIGNAGFLPTIDLSAGYNYSNTISKTTFNGGFPDQNNAAAASQNYNANLNLNYTLFDGERICKKVDFPAPFAPITP